MYSPLDRNETMLVAVKTIKNETSDIEEFLYDFDRELKILAKLKHVNIIKFLGVIRLDPSKLIFSTVSSKIIF